MGHSYPYSIVNYVKLTEDKIYSNNYPNWAVRPVKDSYPNIMFLVFLCFFFLMILSVSLIFWWFFFWLCVFLLFAFFSFCWNPFSLFPLASYSSFTFESLHASSPITCRYTNIFWLVVSTHLTNISQLGWLNMVIFHSYVSLPEGTYVFPNNEQPTKKHT